MSSFFKSSGTSVTIQNTIDTLITDAEAAKIAAQTAATNASTSASLSSTSANNSSTSATNSASSLSSAQSAQGASETARDASVVAKNSAETAATNSGNSASTASTQASNASTSATNASNSATTATTKASEASTSATNAASSASTASGHVTTASTQASNASTSATNAASSASTATTKASEASTSATNASTSASTATTKASEASTSATNASTSASTASTQATNAGNSATASANSATAAGNSATASASSASTAQTLSTSFNEKYRIASSAPSSSLDVGDLYFDTTQGELKVYKSSGWAAAGSTVNGTSARFHYDITGTPTSVSGADAAGNTLAYDAGYVDVYVNGVRMSTADITTTSGNAVVFAEALSASDEVDIVAYGTFVISQLNASNLNSGTIPDARFPATLPAISGANLTNLPVDLTALSASNLTSGTIPSARVSGAYTSITGTGALNSGSITSGFGAINNGASAITSTGVGTFGSLDISGNIDVAGTTNLDVVDIDGAVDMASTLTVTGAAILNGGIDVAGDIILDADGEDIIFKDAGVEIGRFSNSGTNNFSIKSSAQDKDIFFKGNDGGATITALTLDMSDAGTAIFNHDIQLGDDGKANFGAGSDLQIYHDGSNSYIKNTLANGDLILDSAQNFYIKHSGETQIQAVNDGAVNLYHNGAVKLATASTGVNVTGGIGLGGTGTANILDDYEEGTWTPVVENGWGILNPTYSTNVGYYTKIGNLVHITFKIVLNGGSTNGNPLLINVIPFASNQPVSNSGVYQTLEGFFTNASGNAENVFFKVGNINNTRVQSHRRTATGNTPFTGTDAGTAFNCTFSGTYRTDL